MKKIITFIAACASTLLTAQNQQQVIACYPLDCHAQNQTIYGSQLDGLANNVQCIQDRNLIPNNAYGFFGTAHSYIELPNDTLLKSQKISFSGWFRFDQLGIDQYLVFAQNPSNSHFEAFALTINSSNIVQVHKHFGGAFQYAISSTPNAITLQTKWYHIVFYIDNQNMKLYIDNVLQSTLNTPATSIINYLPSASVILGGTNSGIFNRPYFGSMDDVRFYSQQLSTAEMQVLFANNPPCGSPKPTGIDALSSSPVNTKLFPNPSQGKFILESDADLTFTVSDISGKLVANSVSKIEAHQSEISLNEAKAGLYFVNIYDQKGELIRTEKMAVME